jgi:hypothetical protein
VQTCKPSYFNNLPPKQTVRNNFARTVYFRAKSLILISLHVFTVKKGVLERRSGGESVRVTLTTYADRNLVDLRTWFTADGKLKAGKGFAADVRHLPRLAAALAKAVAKATELGLITDNDNDAEAAQ